MNRPFTVAAVTLSAIALFLPARSQTFTRVTIEGRAMRMLVSGSGQSTVVFENGLGPPLEMWGKVQPHVSRFARTVTYDRAGVGLSESGSSPRDGHQVARELRDALRAAGLPPPYVLVGASVGGLYIRVFAGAYPEDVSGMVLVDPTHDPEGVEGSLHPELAELRETAEQARKSRIPPGVPLVLIDAVSSPEVPFATSAIRQLRAKQRPAIEAESRAYKLWLDGIPGARLVTTHHSGHNVPIEQPQLVVETIREVVHAVEPTLGQSAQPLPAQFADVAAVQEGCRRGADAVHPKRISRQRQGSQLATCTERALLHGTLVRCQRVL